MAYVTTKDFNTTMSNISKKTLYTKKNMKLNIKNLDKIVDCTKFSFTDFMDVLNYAEPEFEFELVGCDTILEIGQTISSPKLRLAFTQLGNGTITNIQFYKNDVELGSPQTFTDGVLEYTQLDSGLISNVTYKVVITYNFGTGDQTIEKEIECKFAKRSFYGTTSNDVFVFDSDNIRALAGSKLDLKKGSTFTVDINSGEKEVIIAYPKELGYVTSIKYVEGFNADIKDAFTKQEVQIKDLGTTLSDYLVYTYKPVNPYSKKSTYVVTI